MLLKEFAVGSLLLGNTVVISSYSASCLSGLLAKLYKKNARLFPV